MNRGWEFQDWDRTAMFMIRSFSSTAWELNVDIKEKLFSRHVIIDTGQPLDPEHLRRYLLKAQPYAAPGRAVAQTSIMTTLYEEAQSPTKKSRIIVLKDQISGAVVGSAILYHSRSTLGKLFPLESDQMGGITGIMISDHRQTELVAQSLLAGAAQKLKNQGFSGCCVFLVSDFHDATLQRLLSGSTCDIWMANFPFRRRIKNRCRDC